MSNPKGRQSALKGQITSLKKQLDGHATTPLTAFSYKHIDEKLTEYLEKIDVINEEIYSSTTDVDAQAAQQLEYDAVTESLLDLKNRLRLIPAPDGSQPTAVPGTRHGIRLPKFELPVFNGELCDWTSFSDLFLASIHGNSSLSKGQKLQYLKSTVKGDALTLIQALPITDGNYDEAWTLLKNRYDNKREIVHAHLRRFFSQSSVKTESAAELRRLIDTSNECTRALKVLARPVDEWDDILVYSVMERLDTESRRQWILSLSTDDPSKYSDLIKFLDQRARALVETSETFGKQEQPGGTRKMKNVLSHHGSTEGSCPGCNGVHGLAKCADYLKGSFAERKALIRKHRLCYNCIRAGHRSSECKGGNCQKCKGKHHTSIHEEGGAPAERAFGARTSTVANHSANYDFQQVLLATALVTVRDIHGVPQTVRALLDDGSQGSFVTEACVQRLGLRTSKVHVSVSGVSGAGVGVANKKTLLHVTSLTDGTFATNVNCLVLPKVTRPLPNDKYKLGSWPHLKNLKLADPGFHNPGHIAVLFGADVKADVLLERIRRGARDAPIAQETRLG